MCGIAGISFGEQHDAGAMHVAVERMVAALAHRGPDDDGVTLLGRPHLSTILGNTRLAILDLTPAGHQPMLDPETGNCLALNGELYNHAEVRREIGDRAGGWRSTGDTETLLKAYRLWGEACLARLRGMFAFALWDNAAGELWCARDRLGIKPLYFVEAPGRFAFASELRALLAGDMAARELDERGLAGYLKFGALPEPATIVRGVRSLAAGETMRIRSGKILRRQRYWAVEEFPPVAAAPQRAELRTHLERAIREHLVSDVPVATFLSGGIDSSIVTALAAQIAGRPLRTFTVRFEQPELDESAYARSLAQRYGTVHDEVCLSAPDVLAAVPEAVEALDLPSADGPNTYIVSQAVARTGIKVVLSGLGGDELFGGYDTFRLLPRFERFAGVLGRVPGDLRRYRAGRRSEQATRRHVSFQYRYESMRAYWSDEELRGLGVPDDANLGPIDPGDKFSLVARAGACELQGYMRSTLLRDSDCMSMALSLELRVPFLDHALVEYCLTHSAATAGGKRALVAACRDLLPEEAALRPKQGFVLPMDVWMRTALRAYVRQGLEAAAAGPVPKLSVRRLLADFDSQRVKHSRVWQFAVLGHWCERHRLAMPVPNGLFAQAR